MRNAGRGKLHLRTEFEGMQAELHERVSYTRAAARAAGLELATHDPTPVLVLRHGKASHEPDQLSLGEMSADRPQPVRDLQGQGADARAGEGVLVPGDGC